MLKFLIVVNGHASKRIDAFNAFEAWEQAFDLYPKAGRIEVFPVLTTPVRKVIAQTRVAQQQAVAIISEILRTNPNAQVFQDEVVITRTGELTDIEALAGIMLSTPPWTQNMPKPTTGRAPSEPFQRYRKD